MNQSRRGWRAAIAACVALLAIFVTGHARATPWAEVGDIQLRSDIQVLAAAGLIDNVTMQWPMPWGGIIASLGKVDSLDGQPEYVREAAERVEEKARREVQTDRMNYDLSADFTNCAGRRARLRRAWAARTCRDRRRRRVDGKQHRDPRPGWRSDAQPLRPPELDAGRQLPRPARWQRCHSMSAIRPIGGGRAGIRRCRCPTMRARSRRSAIAASARNRSPGRSCAGWVPGTTKCSSGFSTTRGWRGTRSSTPRVSNLTRSRGSSLRIARLQELCGTGHPCEPIAELFNVQNGNSYQSKSKDEADFDFRYTNTFEGFTYEIYNQEMDRDTGPVRPFRYQPPLRGQRLGPGPQYGGALYRRICRYDLDRVISSASARTSTGSPTATSNMSTAGNIEGVRSARASTRTPGWRRSTQVGAGPTDMTYTLTYYRAWVSSPLTAVNHASRNRRPQPPLSGNLVTTAPVAIDIGRGAAESAPPAVFSVEVAVRLQDDQPRPARGFAAAGELSINYRL